MAAIHHFAETPASGPFAPVHEILEEFRRGRMVIIVDAEDRENEGDLVIPAQWATPDAINFMAMHGRGLICLTLTQARARELDLDFMVRRNDARNRTAFARSIEARDGISTGISAADRARTIAVAVDPARSAGDIVSPGHIFPLIAQEGGVLVRAGHTEASVDLARLAGLLPAAVICEIMNDDGTMARVPDLTEFARRHGLKIGTIEDLIAYRLGHDQIVREVAATGIETAHGDFAMTVFAAEPDGVEHLALVMGDPAAPGPVLVRVHAVDEMHDLLGTGGADPGQPMLTRAMQAVAREGRGVIVVIRDPAANGISGWLARRAALPAAEKKQRETRLVEIGIGSQILRRLGVSEMVLLTNSQSQIYVGLEAFGLRIAATRRLD